jgi:hypothetical protein
MRPRDALRSLLPCRCWLPAPMACCFKRVADRADPRSTTATIVLASTSSYPLSFRHPTTHQTTLPRLAFRASQLPKILSPSNLLAADDPASRPPPITLPQASLAPPFAAAGQQLLHPLLSPSTLSPPIPAAASSSSRSEGRFQWGPVAPGAEASGSGGGFRSAVPSDCGASSTAVDNDDDEAGDDEADDAFSSDGGDHLDYDEQRQPAIPLTPFRNKVGGHSLMWKFKNRAICKVRPLRGLPESAPLSRVLPLGPCVYLLADLCVR